MLKNNGKKQEVGEMEDESHLTERHRKGGGGEGTRDESHSSVFGNSESTLNFLFHILKKQRNQYSFSQSLY